MKKMLPVFGLLIFYCGCICSNRNTIKPTDCGKEAISSMKEIIDNNGKEYVCNYNKEEGMNMTMDQILDELYAAGKECLRERSFLYSPWERSNHINERISRLDKAIFACLDIPARNGHALAAFRLAKLCSESNAWNVRDPSRAEELKEQALLKWGLIRLILLELPMLCNTLFYYQFMNTTFGYMAIIQLLCLPFVVPTMGRCLAEVEE